jgi:hypothetical protein
MLLWQSYVMQVWKRVLTWELEQYIETVVCTVVHGGLLPISFVDEMRFSERDWERSEPIDRCPILRIVFLLQLHCETLNPQYLVLELVQKLCILLQQSQEQNRVSCQVTRVLCSPADAMLGRCVRSHLAFRLHQPHDNAHTMPVYPPSSASITQQIPIITAPHTIFSNRFQWEGISGPSRGA